MNKRILTTTALSAFALVIALYAPLSHVSAQAANGTSGQALEIGPPVLNLSANPGETIKATISLRDVSPTSLLVHGQVNDFIASGEDGTPKIILDEGVTSPYSFKDWVAPLSSLTLKSKQVKTLPITINVPANASPGGYYGVVRFTATPPDLEGTGVSLAASLGSLILLKINGAAKESLSITEFSASHDGNKGTLFETAPIVFTERLKNSGNIHEEPTGTVTITDMFGNTLATLGVNQPTRDILPDSIRKFESSLDETNIGSKILFGLYHAELKVTYGESKQTLTSKFDFWVIPYTLIGIGIVVLVGGFIALRFMIIRYNRAIIERAAKAKRKK
jgi:hypothetical protein